MLRYSITHNGVVETFCAAVPHPAASLGNGICFHKTTAYQHVGKSLLAPKAFHCKEGAGPNLPYSELQKEDNQHQHNKIQEIGQLRLLPGAYLFHNLTSNHPAGSLSKMNGFKLMHLLRLFQGGTSDQHYDCKYFGVKTSIEVPSIALCESVGPGTRTRF